jgi:branched-chain amino acid transport system substrate-binding protein
MNKIIASCILLLILIGVLSIALYELQNRVQKEISPTTVRVGWIGPITGSAKFLGVDNLNAVKLALSEYQSNKRKENPNIKLIIADDEYDYRKTEIEYERMLQSDHKPDAIFISTYSGLKAIANQALKDSVLLIDPIDNDQKISAIHHNIFLIAKETEYFAGVIANALLDQGKKNVAIIYYGGDDFMPTLATTVKDILQSNHIKVDLFKYNHTKTDFQPILNLAKANQADAYVFFGYEEIGLAMKQARDMGITAPFYSANIIMEPKKGLETADGTYFVYFTPLDGNKVKADEFLNTYFETFKIKPQLEWIAMQAYDAATILFQAIQSASHKKGVFIDNLREELLSTSNFDGVSGNITILPSGASRGIYPSLYVLKNHKIVPITKGLEDN